MKCEFPSWFLALGLGLLCNINGVVFGSKAIKVCRMLHLFHTIHPKRGFVTHTMEPSYPLAINTIGL